MSLVSAIFVLLLPLHGNSIVRGLDSATPDLECFARIANDLPPGFLFGVASAAYQASMVLIDRSINRVFVLTLLP